MTVVVSGLWRTWLLLVIHAVGGESSRTLTVDTDIEIEGEDTVSAFISTDAVVSVVVEEGLSSYPRRVDMYRVSRNKIGLKDI